MGMVRFVVVVLLGSAVVSPAQGDFPVREADITAMKFLHYYGPDRKFREADFVITFTKDTFTLKKGKAAIPADLLNQLLPKGETADEVAGKWTLKGGKLMLTEIRAGKKEGLKEASLGVYKTAPTVLRIGSVPQYVFAVER
jgi:hypothetical protein